MQDSGGPVKIFHYVISKSWTLPIIFMGLSAFLYISSVHQDFMKYTISNVQSPSHRLFIEPSWNQTNGLTANTALSSASRFLAPSIENKVEKKILTPELGVIPPTCKVPIQRIVYIKTHKTGSTTLVSILERYGYKRNMSFAMRKNGHIICDIKLFETSMISQIPFRTRRDFDLLVNHARYSRPEMDKVVPHAKYISIIRHPVTQLESVFGYFEVGHHLGISGSNPFKTFMSNPRMYYERKASAWQKIRNGQLFDLGLDHKYDENKGKIQEKIDQLSKEIDFMLINEYFDESLIILRKLFCWDFEDILYLSHGIRSKTHRYRVSDDLADDVLEWNAGDAMLYKHFNQTFWEKVNDYGPDFEKDLQYFHSLEQKAFNECINEGEKNRKDRRVEKFILKKDSSNFCKDMLRDDVAYASLIMKGMVNRAVLEAKKSGRWSDRRVPQFARTYDSYSTYDNRRTYDNHRTYNNRRKIRPDKVALAIPARRIIKSNRASEFDVSF